MTEPYEALIESPQPDINRSQLSPEERAELRRLHVSGCNGITRSNTKGRFSAVYYLEGDIRAAAARFVEENRERLEQIDFSKSNGVWSSVSREAYDWILHWLGERHLKILNRAVYESRSDVDWIISRDKYYSAPNRRYSTGSPGSVKIDGTSPDAIYRQLPSRATVEEIPDTVIGDREWLFVYFDEHPEFECLVRHVGGSASVWKYPECIREAENQ
ncbi:hypothetical protein SAMN04487947_0457 [Halogeometricum rufum]|uniref:Uncharacterized protein n=1 Tax=Halogeometricum rufum TaxID=553469 RepID=A0A1I6G2N4_9EURY|nr:hypothetical protein SAMN04487947_0457 [Halogeometricum rufum]